MSWSRRLLFPGTALTFLAAVACFSLHPSGGGGETRFSGSRTVRGEDVALPSGYRIEAVARGLTFPTGVAFDDSGRAYVVESGYSYGEVFLTPRLLRIESDGRMTAIASGTNNGPWNGVAYADGHFYVAEGGEREGGRLLRIDPQGRIERIVEGLPSLGDHHTDGPVVGRDGYLYFGQGTATNSGIVGEDNAQFGWLSRHPDFHDVPCQDVTLAGKNYRTRDALHRSGSAVETGAFQPYGTPAQAGARVAGKVPCTGAILRVRTDGGPVELVAWGLRNPFGLAISPDGQLYVAENQFDVRGSRPVWGAGDLLWAIRPGTWYGWPDYHAGRRLDGDDRYNPPAAGPRPVALLAAAPGTPPQPAAVLGVHASACGLDFSRSPSFGFVGEAFIAEFGDMAPAVGKTLAPVGFRVVRVNLGDGVTHDFASNRGTVSGPASKIGGGGLERPVAARFSPDGSALYVVDFGVLTMDGDKSQPRRETGVLWRITRDAVAEKR